MIGEVDAAAEMETALRKSWLRILRTYWRKERLPYGANAVFLPTADFLSIHVRPIPAADVGHRTGYIMKPLDILKSDGAYAELAGRIMMEARIEDDVFDARTRERLRLLNENAKDALHAAITYFASGNGPRVCNATGILYDPTLDERCDESLDNALPSASPESIEDAPEADDRQSRVRRAKEDRSPAGWEDGPLMNKGIVIPTPDN